MQFNNLVIRSKLTELRQSEELHTDFELLQILQIIPIIFSTQSKILFGLNVASVVSKMKKIIIHFESYTN